VDALSRLSPKQWAQVENRIEAFERAWQAGQRPRIADHLPGEPVLRTAVVVELAHIDLELRIKAREAARVESYLTEFAEIAEQSERVVELIRTELRWRTAAGEAVEATEYQRRFPSLYDSLPLQVSEGPLSTQSLTLAEAKTLPPRPGARESETPRDLPERLGRYRILRLLGHGSMGTVYLAEDTQLGRRVALKTPRFRGDNSRELLARFYSEARSAALLRHPHICPVYDFGEVDGKHFLSMAYIDGRTLASCIQPGTPYPERNILIVIRKLALALDEAHQHGIVHRDLTPSNVMIDQRNEPIIMDFGLARQIDGDQKTRLTQFGTLIGSPAYMSPEQVAAESDRIGPPTDQYALGVIFYELLTGRLPFRGTITAVIGQILAKKPTPPSQLRANLDPRIEAVCLKMMAKRRRDRFPSMKAVANELTAILRNPGDKPPVEDLLAEVMSEAIPKSDTTSPTERAKKCLKRHDYEGAVRVIEEIPATARDAEQVELLTKARDLCSEVSVLEEEIAAALERGEGPVAVAKAARLGELKPNHPDVQEVRRHVRRGTLPNGPPDR
jgi:serine/threonine protein kinase